MITVNKLYITSDGSLRLRSLDSDVSRPNLGEDWLEGVDGREFCWQNKPSISDQSRSAIGECWWLRATTDQMLWRPTTYKKPKNIRVRKKLNVRRREWNKLTYSRNNFITYQLTWTTQRVVIRVHRSHSWADCNDSV